MDPPDKLNNAAKPNNGKPPETSNIEKQKKQVDEVKEIMIDNLNKIAEREQKLDDLDKRAGELEEKASLFQKATKKLEKKFWWREHKMKIMIGGGVLAVLLILSAGFFFL